MSNENLQIIDRFTNMVSRCSLLDDVGYIHRGQSSYVRWCIGVVSSEQVEWCFFTSAAVFTQYIEICLIAYRFAVEVSLVYEIFSAIELVFDNAMEGFSVAVICRATWRYAAMFDAIACKRLLKSTMSCASGGHNELRSVVCLQRY